MKQAVKTMVETADRLSTERKITIGAMLTVLGLAFYFGQEQSRVSSDILYLQSELREHRNVLAHGDVAIELTKLNIQVSAVNAQLEDTREWLRRFRDQIAPRIEALEDNLPHSGETQRPFAR